MTDIVECHSGYAYAEKPVALTWGGQRLIIDEILSEGRTPQEKWFRVRTEDGQVFELTFAEALDGCPSNCEWRIHQF